MTKSVSEQVPSDPILQLAIKYAQKYAIFDSVNNFAHYRDARQECNKVWLELVQAMYDLRQHVASLERDAQTGPAKN